jgi:hypothetical protein
MTYTVLVQQKTNINIENGDKLVLLYFECLLYSKSPVNQLHYSPLHARGSAKKRLDSAALEQVSSG